MDSPCHPLPDETDGANRLSVSPRRLLRITDTDGSVEPVSVEALRPFDFVFSLELGQSHIGQTPCMVVLAIDEQGDEARA